MPDKDLLETIKLNDLDRGISGECFKLSACYDKHSKPSIRAWVNGTSNLFSYSKYGLKMAKKWIMDELRKKSNGRNH